MVKGRRRDSEEEQRVLRIMLDPLELNVQIILLAVRSKAKSLSRRQLMRSESHYVHQVLTILSRRRIVRSRLVRDHFVLTRIQCSGGREGESTNADEEDEVTDRRRRLIQSSQSYCG